MDQKKAATRFQVAAWPARGAYFLQQSLVQVFFSALQQAAQLAHFSAA